ncbi:MAG TPA: guanylate kinase [Bacteroidota bacterium]
MPGTAAPAGKLVVISAPSGAGKTTIARAMLERFPSLSFSVSATTRPRRETEVDGRDYFFLAREEFERRIAAGEFVEWEKIYGDYYGTLKAEVARAAREGRGLLFDIDVKGGLSIKRQYPHALLIFIRPPDLETLRRRLQNRRTEDAATLARRMERATMELELGTAFDCVCVNDELARAVAEVEKILEHYLTT